MRPLFSNLVAHPAARGVAERIGRLCRQPTESLLNYGAVAVEYVGTAVLSLISSVIIVRGLSTETYGQYQYTATLTSYLLFFSGWGMMYFAPRELNQRRAEAPAVLRSIIQTRLLVSMPLPFVAAGIYWLVPGRNIEVAAVILLQTIAVGVNCFSAELPSVFAAFNKQRLGVVAGLIASLGLLVSTSVFFLGLGWKTQTAAAAAVLVAPLGGAVVSYWFLHRHVVPGGLGRWKWEGARVRHFLREGWVIIPGRFCVQFYATAGMLFIGWFVSLHEAAVFRVATAFYICVIGVSLLTQRITEPAVWKFSNGSSMRELSAALARDITYGTVVSFFAVGLVFLLGEDLLVLLYGETYRAAYWSAGILCSQLIFQSTAAPVSTVLLGQRRNRTVLVLWVTGAVCALILNACLIPWLGIVGAALAMVLVNGAVNLPVLWILKGHFHLNWMKILAGPSVGLTVMLLVAWWGNPWMNEGGFGKIGLVFLAALGYWFFAGRSLRGTLLHPS